MIKYGSDLITELRFIRFDASMERRDNQWVDIVLQPTLDESTPVPDDLIQFTVYVICTLDGTIVQMIPQDEDCDCEYQLTFSEKEQVRAYIMQSDIQEQISNLTPPQ
ncbi:hypothetical protein D3P07_08295 [Paenibacillus sp. 1011MAR3C5]|uniref:hypothetical protein n=1 Tax=Paenibacillus sp. 1011MAR3C5 TaxID=1675787 RepID=UPI000E6D45BE|nr:hypothetical protein [Paenibacillus sp. 1011MAR3C5]RJE90200.1 hypothetical protein D3P07_08295 [Paenibacillus sp. 1011MAR3C5]